MLNMNNEEALAVIFANSYDALIQIGRAHV